jgi:hypothetical protein
MYVFRIHIRPQGGLADMKTTFDYCLKNGILGVGWRTSSNRNTKNWNEYHDEASQEYENLDVCKYIQKWVSPGDLAWTRDPSGHYYLGRVISGWEYWTTEESKRLDIDVANTFRCELRYIDIDEVPGKIIAYFRAPRTILEIPDDKAREYSRHLWNKLSGQEVYQVDKAKYSDIFMMLDDQETEDLVFLYLQSKGWYIIPHSRKRDSMTFEYLCVNPSNGQIAGTQVKTGNTPLNRDEYVHFPHKVFLFQSNEFYFGNSNENVESISRCDLEKFLHESAQWLPKIFKRKIEITNHN